jgi:hypothetical protein
MSRSWAGGSTRRWRKLRESVLNRDGHLCQVPVAGGRRCGAHATHVDHITPLANGGAKWDPTNCRAACQPCNLSRGASTVAGPTIPVTVVIGPPAAGKTSWALLYAMSGDVVIDLDRIAAALRPVDAVGHTYPQHVRHVAIGARQAALRRAVALPASSGARAWVIHAIPTAAQLKAYVGDGWTVHVCDPGADVVRARITSSSRGRRHMDAVDRWYATREQLLEQLQPAPAWDW